MQARIKNHRPRSSLVFPFVWLFLATALIKGDDVEAIHPFFRLMIFAILPLALLHLCRSVVRARLSGKCWLGLCVLGYLLLYPLTTIFLQFSNDKVRDVKDYLYLLSIYCSLFFLLRLYFTDKNGFLDLQSIGRFWVSFALWQSIFAVAFFMGLRVPLGFGLEFHQMEWLGTRLHGFMGTPSHLGPVVAVACAFLATRKLKVISALKITFLFIVLVMTGSRGSLAGFFGALAIFFLVNMHRLRLRGGSLMPLTLGVMLVTGVVVAFPDLAGSVLSEATRVEPDGWEKSRPVMWALRLEEYASRDLHAQIFGAGHRAVKQTFNVNIEYLVNYGAIYLFVFNFVFAAVLWRFLRRAYRMRDAGASFLLMMGVSSYLFMQGLSPIFYAFIHGTQICMVIILIAYFEFRPRSVPRILTLSQASNLSRGAAH